MCLQLKTCGLSDMLKRQTPAHVIIGATSGVNPAVRMGLCVCLWARGQHRCCCCWCWCCLNKNNFYHVWIPHTYIHTHTPTCTGHEGRLTPPAAAACTHTHTHTHTCCPTNNNNLSSAKTPRLSWRARKETLTLKIIKDKGCSCRDTRLRFPPMPWPFCKCRETHSTNNYPPGYDKVGNFMPCCLNWGIPVSSLWKSLSYISIIYFKASELWQ